MNDKKKIEQLRAALLVLLDQVDYTKGACSLVERVGAVLSTDVIKLCRKAIKDTEQ